MTLSQEQVYTVAQLGLCSEKILSETAQTVKAILHDCTKDGLPTILNRIQLSKNRVVARNSNGIADSKTLEMTCLYANGLNAMIETATVKSSRGAESLSELENYADLMEGLSEI